MEKQDESLPPASKRSKRILPSAKGKDPMGKKRTPKEKSSSSEQIENVITAATALYPGVSCNPPSLLPSTAGPIFPVKGPITTAATSTTGASCTNPPSLRQGNEFNAGYIHWCHE